MYSTVQFFVQLCTTFNFLNKKNFLNGFIRHLEVDEGKEEDVEGEKEKENVLVDGEDDDGKGDCYQKVVVGTSGFRK